MSTTLNVYGEVYWHMHKRTDKWGKYGVQIYVDDATRKAIKAAGLKVKPNLDDDGRMFFRFSKKPTSWDADPPKVWIDGKEVDVEVGNGTKATLSLEVYEFKSGVDSKGNEYAGGTGHRWQNTSIESKDFIPYKRESRDEQPVTEEKKDLPF